MCHVKVRGECVMHSPLFFMVIVFVFHNIDKCC
nr:MAG TPA: hypothetical protein [Caudoviricetes sp.]DAU73005.1 MAG TPA: hypothetical protein [Caudoviricetes sp.]